MAMVASVLANSIKSAMTDLNNALGDHPENANPSDYSQAFDNSLKTFIEDNCEITYSWTASNSVPSPDPVVSFQASVSFPSFSIGNQPDLDTWATALATQILGGVITPDDSSFVISPGSFLQVSPLSIPSSNLTDSDAAMLFVCDKIINWIKTCINPSSVSGTHQVQYVGSGVMTVIN